MFATNNFALSDAEDNTFKPMNRGGIADLPFFENTIGNSPKALRAKFLERDGLFCFISICKFGSFKSPFATITGLCEISFRFRRFILLVQTKKVISINYGSSTSTWKRWRWVKLDLTLSMRDRYIYSNLNPPTSIH